VSYTQDQILDALTRNQLLSLVDRMYAGDFNRFTKTDLRRFIRRHPTSRFENLLTSSSVLRLVEQNRRAALRAKQRAKKKKATYRRIAGRKVEAPQYDIEIEFSEDGEAFGNPLDVKSNTTYHCRMRLRQHMGEFNCIGFALNWKKTSNLSWADGYGTRTYEEAISNPLVITRKVRTRTIAAGTSASVKVVVVDRYL
jgi:hypothetical protein